MENEAMQQVVQPPVTPAPAVAPPPKPGRVPALWLIAGTAIVIGIGGLLVARTLLSAPKPPPEQIVEAPTPTPTPIRVLSTVATQSAFLSLAQSHASLSAGLAATNLDDPSLAPPVLVLPLGFRP